MNTARLESALGHTFRSPELLEQALTHRSWAHEKLISSGHGTVRAAANESFEFVGDSVLGLVIAETLFAKHPMLGEGDLTLMKHRLVSTPTLAALAQKLELGLYIKMSRGEEKTGGREKSAILADTLEAVFAAVFFDGGYSKARAVIKMIFADDLRNATPRGSIDYKTLLQETLQAQKLAAPTYTLLRTEGMPHARTFFVEANWDAGRSEGSGRSIKSAEMRAAAEALTAMAAAEDDSKSKRKVNI